MPLKRVIGQASVSDSSEATLAAPILNNCYYDHAKQIRKKPGYTLFRDLSNSSATSGSYYWSKFAVIITVLVNGDIYWTQGNTSRLVSATVTAGSLRPIFTSDGIRVWFASGGNIITITSDGVANYVVETATSFPPLNCSHVAYHNGRILGNLFGTDEWRYTEVGDPADSSITTGGRDEWTAGNDYSADYKPDTITGLYSYFSEVVLLGKNSIEFWYDNGADPPFGPYAPIGGGARDVGCVAPYSPCIAGNALYWLDNERRVVTLKGRDPIPVSGDIQRDLYALSSVTDCVSLVMQNEGDTLIHFNFPTAGKTFVLNTNTGTWSTWGGYDTSTDSFTTSENYISAMLVDNADLAGNEPTQAYISSVSVSGSGVSWGSLTNMEGPPDFDYDAISFTSSTSAQVLHLAFPAMPLLTSDTNILGVSLDLFTINRLYETGSSKELGAYILATEFKPQSNTTSTLFLTASSTIHSSATTSTAISGTTAQAISSNIALDSTVLVGGSSNLWGATQITPSLLASGVVAKVAITRTDSAGGTIGWGLMAARLTVSYASGALSATPYAVIVGSKDSAKLFALSPTAYNENDGATTTGIRCRIDTNSENYETMVKKRTDRFIMRFRPSTSAGSIRTKSDNGKWSNPMRFSMSDGSYDARRMGIYETRQYRIEHEADAPFVFIEADEQISILRR